MCIRDSNYALQDILGLPYDFAKDLPPEANSEDGFQNSSELLHMSVSQLESYRRLARKALGRATIRGERPPVLRWAVTMKDAARIDRKKQQEEFDEEKAKIADEEEKLARLTAGLSKSHSGPYYKDLKTGRTVAASWRYQRATYAFPPLDAPSEVPKPSEQVAILPRNSRRRLTVELGDQLPDEGLSLIHI